MVIYILNQKSPTQFVRACGGGGVDFASRAALFIQSDSKLTVLFTSNVVILQPFEIQK